MVLICGNLHLYLVYDLLRAADVVCVYVFEIFCINYEIDSADIDIFMMRSLFCCY